MAERILIYSHDTFGLGNIRRNHKLARALVEGIPGVRVLLLTGSRWFHYLPQTRGIEFVKLPELTRVRRGGYRSRAEGVGIDPLVKARREILLGAARGFQPDLCLVDKTPTGIEGELEPALGALREADTRIVLALRDILDEPEWTREHWTRTGQYDALASYYDGVWVLGNADVFPTSEAYRLDEISGVDVRYVGYLDQTEGRRAEQDQDRPGERALITVGGGEDGRTLLLAVADALERIDPGRRRTDVVLGPFLAPEDRARVRDALVPLDGVRCLDYTTDVPRRIRNARAVISMAGYNTVCEILSTSTPALVVPRTIPSREQSLRATYMSRRGFFETDATDVGALPSVSVIREFLEAVRPRVECRPPLTGLDQAVALACGA